MVNDDGEVLVLVLKVSTKFCCNFHIFLMEAPFPCRCRFFIVKTIEGTFNNEKVVVRFS